MIQKAASTVGPFGSDEGRLRAYGARRPRASRWRARAGAARGRGIEGRRAGERMALQHQGLEALVEDVGVDLGGGDVGVAEKRLDRAQVGAVREQVRGEGVAQRVRRDLGGIDAAPGRDLLDEDVEAMARQVPFAGGRGEEVGRAAPPLGLARVADREPGGRGGARGRRKRHHALAPALAADQEPARVAARRRGGQGYELGHAHAGGVEHLHQAGVARALGLRAPHGGGGVEHPVHLLLRKRPRQAAVAARAADLDRGVVGAPALLEGEAVELADRGEPARAGRAREAGRGAVDEVVLHVRALRGLEAQGSPAEPAREVLEVAPVGELGVARGPELGRLRLQKGLDPMLGGDHGASPPEAAPPRIRSWSAARRAVSSNPARRRKRSAPAR